MMCVSVGHAADHLSDLLHGMGPNDQIALTESGQTVARIVSERAVAVGPRRRGACKGMLDILDDGDDAVLEQFAAYLP